MPRYVWTRDNVVFPHSLLVERVMLSVLPEIWPVPTQNISVCILASQEQVEDDDIC